MWYIATIVLEITVAGDARNVIHENCVLVRAESPEEAHRRALELGGTEETTYFNPDGKRVSIRFAGLGDVSVVQDALEHGGELFYREHVGLSEAQVRSLLRRRSEMAIFREAAPSSGPDYSSGEIMDKARRLARGEETR